MAYKLILPEENSVHLIFHVSLLNKKVGNVVIVSSILLEGEWNRHDHNLSCCNIRREAYEKR